MSAQAFGIMIARGDLAVEIGFERMSEIQEEILWICEAAHVPVVWATQVLETLNKSGMATRSEITDAAHAAMAECIMINKGDHTIEVIETLRDILQRTGGLGKELVFVIGSGIGLHESLKHYSNYSLSLSPLTFPHNMARIILAEQIYRACTILGGKEYHK